MVSVVIINYNDKNRIVRAINSALNQSYKDKEVIVVDDGSDIETRELYKQFKDIKLVQLERDNKTARTPSRARNEGIKVAKGNYICFLDSDNYYNVDFLKEMCKYNHDVMYCNWKITGLKEMECKIEKVYDMNHELLNNYLARTHLDHQCLLIKKSLLDKVGMYDERLPRSQDCDMIVRLMKVTDDWYHVPETLFIFEKHEGDQTKNVASIYGKALWCMKLGLNLNWLIDKIKDYPILLWSIFKAVNDFKTKPEWKDDFEKSPYYEVDKKHPEMLGKELQEVING